VSGNNISNAKRCEINLSPFVIEITGAEFKHLTVVTRKTSGNIVQVLDGQGMVYTVELTAISKNAAHGKIHKRSRFVGEPNFRLTLAQAIPKGSRFDLVIEKGTEIGISAFIPLITSRTIISGNENKLQRWQHLAIAAMKQCGRSLLPPIAAPRTLEQIFTGKEIYDFRLIAHPAGKSLSLAEILLAEKKKFASIAKIKSGIILIGPEGGFSDDEIEQAHSYNYKCFTLGQRRFRSETAGIVAAAIAMELIDNF